LTLFSCKKKIISTSLVNKRRCVIVSNVGKKEVKRAEAATTKIRMTRAVPQNPSLEDVTKDLDRRGSRGDEKGDEPRDGKAMPETRVRRGQAEGAGTTDNRAGGA
jgi:hypothetical protein